MKNIRYESMKSFSFISPSLDLGCEDGAFSFIRRGISARFDVFSNVEHLDRYWDNIDVYDSFHEDNKNTQILKKC